MENAKIHAENAIRQKNQSINYLRMSARVDAVASRVQTAITTKRVTQGMTGVVKAMDAAMKSMSLEKISSVMDKFEKQFEDLCSIICYGKYNVINNYCFCSTKRC